MEFLVIFVVWISKVDSAWGSTLPILCRQFLNSMNSTSANNSSVEDSQEKGLYDKDRHALLYIVVVLLFYSLGIIIGIITYLKREKREIEEDRRYEDYMNFRNDPDKLTRYFSVQRMVSHLNQVEAEKELRRKQEELEARKMSAEKLTKKSFLMNFRRGSKEKPAKKRFSLVDSSLFSALSRSKECEVNQSKRRWSLKPIGLGGRASRVNDPLKEHEMHSNPSTLDNFNLRRSPSSRIEVVEEEPELSQALSIRVDLTNSVNSLPGTSHVQSKVSHMTDLWWVFEQICSFTSMLESANILAHLIIDKQLTYDLLWVESSMNDSAEYSSVLIQCQWLVMADETIWFSKGTNIPGNQVLYIRSTL